MAKALVVDDSGVIRKMVNKVLVDNGHETVMAENGQDAFELFEADNFDIVITDINMPIMNGLELTKSIRESSHSKANLPIIVVSTEFSDDIKAQGKELGVNAWMIKPCDEQKLIAALDHFLK